MSLSSCHTVICVLK